MITLAMRAWDNLAESFGAEVYRLRREVGLTQEELAAAIRRRGVGCSKGYISFIERAAPNSKTGKPMRPSEEIVDALALALGQPVGSLRSIAGYADRTDAPAESREHAHAASVLLDPPFAEDDPVILSIIAHYTGAPPEARSQMFREIVKVALAHQRDGVTHGKRADGLPDDPAERLSVLERRSADAIHAIQKDADDRRAEKDGRNE